MKTEEEIRKELEKVEQRLKFEPFYGTPDTYAKIVALEWVLED